MITVSAFNQLMSISDVSLFEEAFQKHNATDNPLYVATIIENGYPIGMKLLKKMTSSNTEIALLSRGFSSNVIDKNHGIETYTW